MTPNRFLIACALASGLALTAPAAHATLLDFTWSDTLGDTASWTQDSNPSTLLPGGPLGLR